MNKVNILVVDDRPEGVLAVQAVLDSPSYNIVTASSGNEALKHLLQKDFAVILLDVQMPIMNGFETATLIKTRERSKDIPIIFMSAINQDEQYVYQGYGVGAIDYIMKPFDPYILRSKVAIFVELFRKNQLIREQSLKLRETEARAHAQEIDRIEIENLRKYQYLADSIPLIVFKVLPDGKLDYFNKSWFDYTGLTMGRSMGLNWKDVIHPEDLPALLELFKVSESDAGTYCECRILNRFGEFRWHLIRVQAERYGDPDIIATWLGTATDIQDRKKNEEAHSFLAAAGEQLVSSLDYAKTMESAAKIAVPFLADWCSLDRLNAEGTVENLVVFHRDNKNNEALREIYRDYVCKEDCPSKEVILSGKHKYFTSIEKVAAGMSKIGDSSALILPLVLKGKVLGTITFGSYRDRLINDENYLQTAKEFARRVTYAIENADLYKISQEAIQIRNDFLSIASHELNTPITSLKLQLQMVRKTLQTQKDGKVEVDRFSKSVDASVRQVDRLINLIQILLDVSRIQSGKLTFNPQRFPVKEVVNEVVERHKELLHDSDCTLKVINEKDIEAYWDKTRIEQVITNLLTNAIKYAPGKIELLVQEDKEEILISVKDFGKGIPKSKVSSIFDRFERATSNDSISGLGLGLFIVKQIIEGHHGQIEVDSVENEGTTFSLRLPKDVRPFIEQKAGQAESQLQ